MSRCCLVGWLVGLSQFPKRAGSYTIMFLSEYFLVCMFVSNPSLLLIALIWLDYEQAVLADLSTCYIFATNRFDRPSVTKFNSLRALEKYSNSPDYLILNSSSMQPRFSLWSRSTWALKMTGIFTFFGRWLENINCMPLIQIPGKPFSISVTFSHFEHWLYKCACKNYI